MDMAVCSGLRQVQTFIFSTLSTVSRSAYMTPPSSSGGRPLVYLSSMTRYSVSSALTKGAVKVWRSVTMV